MALRHKWLLTIFGLLCGYGNRMASNGQVLGPKWVVWAPIVID